MNTISVIIPTYNRASTIGRAITSAIGQTRAPDEILVIDDASTDETIEIVKSYPMVKIVSLARNSGAAHARNAGIKLAKGTLIAFLDSDDIWVANRLDEQLKRFAAQPNLQLLGCGTTVQKPGQTAVYRGCMEHAPLGGWTMDELQSQCFSTPTWLVRRAVLNRAGLFDEGLQNREDLDLLVRIAELGSIGAVNAPLVIKYIQKDSLDADKTKLLNSLSSLMQRYPEYWKRSPRTAIFNYRVLANIAFRNGRMQQGRRSLIQALQIKWQLPTALLLALSILGPTLYNKIHRSSEENT